MPQTIGIDIGGTNIKAGLVDAAGNIIRRAVVSTDADRGFEHVFGLTVGLIRELLSHCSEPRAVRIGVGVPGPMSHARGIVFNAPNLPGWVNVPLRDRLQEATGLPASVENDANSAAFGEFVAGAGRGRDMVALTLGTGIGGGIILGGKLWRGWKDTAGEVGHAIVAIDGRPCPCGQRGCLERYSSATAIAERYREFVHTPPHPERVRADSKSSALAERVRCGAAIDSRDVLSAASDGDVLARRVWDEACKYLAVACVGLKQVLNPEVIVLAGGLIEAGDALLTPVREHFDRQVWKIASDLPTLELATLRDAGIIGAAALAAE
ncbi:MAG: ROK family protein [Phycisphaerae bacterium]